MEPRSLRLVFVSEEKAKQVVFKLRQVQQELELIYMGDFPQPQQKYAGIGENCNVVITVIFYPVI